MSELTGLRQRAPGLGSVPHGETARSMVRNALLQQQQIPVVVTTTKTSGGKTCYWGAHTLYSTLEGCVPGDKGGKPASGKGCRVYDDIEAAQNACGELQDCGGIAINKDGTAEIRKGRWLQSDLKKQAMEKLACGKFELRAKGAGGESETRGCNLKDFQVEGEFGKSLEECQKFCLQSSPRRPSGYLSTGFVEYHNDTYCGCFSRCEMNRHPAKYASTSDIYELVSPDIVTKEHVPYLERYKNNPCLGKVCAFSDAKTWGEAGIPTAKDTDMIYVPENVTLLIDQDVDIRYWVVEGTLIPADKNLHIKAEGIFVNGGTLRVGTEKKPFE